MHYKLPDELIGVGVSWLDSSSTKGEFDHVTIDKS
jgi:hypothetical protein